MADTVTKPLTRKRQPLAVEDRKQQRSRSMRLGASWAIAVGGILLGALLSWLGMKLEGGALAVLAFAPLYYSLDRNLMPEFPFGPCVYLYVFHAVGFSLGPLGQRYITKGIETFYEEGFVQAQWGAVIGLGVFAIVYPVVFRKMSRNSASENTQGFQSIPRSQWTRFSLLLLMMSAIIIAFAFLSGSGRRLGPRTQVGVVTASVGAVFDLIPQIAFFFLAYCAARFRGKWFWLWLAAFVVYTVVTNLDGSRGPTFIAMFISAIGAVAGGVSRRQVLTGTVALTIVLIPLVGIVGDYRSNYRYVGGVSERVEGLVTSATDYLDRYQEGSVGLADAMIRENTAHTADLIFLLTPRYIPFAGLDGLDRLLYLYVPRVLAPNRKSLDDGAETTCLYGVAAGQKRASDPMCAVGDYTPLVGEGYRRFGWPGIPLLYAQNAIVFGVALGWAWNSRGRLAWVAILVMLILSSYRVWLHTFLATFYLVGWIIPKYVIALWALYKLIGPATSTSPGRQAPRQGPVRLAPNRRLHRESG